jgi:hypothetical protein
VQWWLHLWVTEIRKLSRGLPKLSKSFMLLTCMFNDVRCLR